MSGIQMTSKERAVVLLVVQAVLVLSIAGKYLYERKVCPRVWVRAEQYDLNAPLRGRYLALRLVVDACGLPKDQAHRMGRFDLAAMPDTGSWRWNVKPVVEDGKLVPALASETDRPEVTDELIVWGNGRCDRAVLSKRAEYFIADSAQGPFPLKKGAELWVEVTVPPMGPPRPIQLAISEDGTFTPLSMR
jgi:hypothetical protein